MNPPDISARLFAAAFVLSLSAAPAMADCSQHAADAQRMLSTFKQNAMAGQKQDVNSFKAKLESTVNHMQAEQCSNELMGLLNHIQTEQQQYPDPRKNPEAYR